MPLHLLSKCSLRLIEIPDLDERVYMLGALLYAYFSSNAVCMLMNYDKNKL